MRIGIYDPSKDFGPNGCCEGVVVLMVLGAVLGALGGAKLAGRLNRRCPR